MLSKYFNLSLPEFLLQTQIFTRNSAVANKPRDAFVQMQ